MVEVSSSGTDDWHVGHPMDRRAAATADRRRVRPAAPRAPASRTPTEGGGGGGGGGGVDLVLAMDDANLRDLGGRADRIRKFRDFDPPGQSPEGERRPDPYYGGDDGFEEVLTMVERTASAIVEALGRERPVGRPGRPHTVTRQPLVARRAEELLGTSVIATAPMAGGDIATATRLRLSDGTTALMKTLPHARRTSSPTRPTGCAGWASRPRRRAPRCRPSSVPTTST